MDAARRRRDHVQGLGGSARRTEPADYARAKRPTPRATPTAPGRSCSRSSSRAAAGSWSAIPTGGARRSTRTTSTASFTLEEDEAGNLAALLDGEIDLLQTPSYSAIDQIRAQPGLKLVHRPKLLTMFFGLDQGSAELRSSNVKGKNPFKDKRVRQAMAHAIDIEPILHDLMGELFIPAGMMSPRASTAMRRSWTSRSLTTRKSQGFAREAGYPDGFSVTLDCPNEWGDDEIADCRARPSSLAKSGSRSPSISCPRTNIVRKSRTIAKATFSSTAGTWIRIPRGCSETVSQPK